MPYTFNPFTGTLDYYATSSGSGVPGGSSGDLQYNNAGAFGGITPTRGVMLYGDSTPSWAVLAKPSVLSGLSHDGTDVSWVTATGTGAPVRAIAPTFTSTVTDLQSIGATSTDGFILSNTTAAAAGAQQRSPRLRLTGRGWKTDATAASQGADWIIENVPIEGAAAPTTQLNVLSQINGAGYVQRVAFVTNNSTATRIEVGTSAYAWLAGDGSGNLTSSIVLKNAQRQWEFYSDGFVAGGSFYFYDRTSNRTPFLINSAGVVGIGGDMSAQTLTGAVLAVSAAQVKLNFDASNFSTDTVSSVGSRTIAVTGTNPSITLTPSGSGIIGLNGAVHTTPSLLSYATIDAGTSLIGSSVEATTTDTSTTAKRMSFNVLQVNPASNPASNTVHAALAAKVFIPAANAVNLSNVSARVLNSSVDNLGTGTLRDGWAGNYTVTQTGAGTITNGAAVRGGGVTSDVAAVITELRVFEVVALSNTGSIPAATGFYCGSMTAGTQATTPFSFKSTDTAALQSFMGNSGFGTAAPTAQLSVAEKLLITSAGIVSKYNNVATAGWGVPAIVASGRSTAQTAAVASIATFTPAADGSFEVTFYLLITTSVAFSFTLQVTYTDTGGTSRTATMSALVGTTYTNAGGAASYEGIPMSLRAKANTAITAATVGVFTTVTYDVEAQIRQVA